MNFTKISFLLASIIVYSISLELSASSGIIAEALNQSSASKGVLSTHDIERAKELVNAWLKKIPHSKTNLKKANKSIDDLIELLISETTSLDQHGKNVLTQFNTIFGADNVDNDVAIPYAIENAANQFRAKSSQKKNPTQSRLKSAAEHNPSSSPYVAPEHKPKRASNKHRILASSETPGSTQRTGKKRRSSKIDGKTPAPTKTLPNEQLPDLEPTQLFTHPEVETPSKINPMPPLKEINIAPEKNGAAAQESVELTTETPFIDDVLTGQIDETDSASSVHSDSASVSDTDSPLHNESGEEVPHVYQSPIAETSNAPKAEQSSGNSNSFTMSNALKVSGLSIALAAVGFVIYKKYKDNHSDIATN